MTIKELLAIISTLPEESPIILVSPDVNDLKTVDVEYHVDGRIYVVLSASE